MNTAMFHIYSLDFAERAALTEADLPECEALIDRLIDLSEKARRVGLLTLEDEVRFLPYLALRKGIELICDGTDPQTVRAILAHHVICEPRRGKDLVIHCIILEGVLAIQAGEWVRILRERLSLFLGQKRAAELLEPAESKPPAIDRAEELRGFLAMNSKNAPLGRAARTVGKQLLTMNDRVLQRLMREILQEILADFLSGAEGRVIARILTSMSLRAACELQSLISSRQYYRNRAQVDRGAKRIRNILKALETAGEINLQSYTHPRFFRWKQKLRQWLR